MQSRIELLKALEAKRLNIQQNRILNTFRSFYDWQQQFTAASKNYFEMALIAANQIGKSRTGRCMDAMHLTGDYPDDWPGHRFDFAPTVWGLGYSMEKTRDLLQKGIFGEYEAGKGFKGGLIPKDRIISWESAPGVSNAMRTVRVAHKSGDVSVCQFWSYSQGQHAMMGDVVDWVHVDEEPRDQTIRPQILTRTVNGDKGKGGKIIYTLTPENGRTNLVIKFMDNPEPSQFFMQKGWKDAPHMTPEKRERLLGQYPDHQKKMRTEGEPMLGHGRIYDIDDDFILCDPFQIPDFWKVICSLDFGYDHPQAVIKLAIDPDNDITYLVNSWKASKVSANDAFGATKSWAMGVPVAWPHDGLQHEKGREDAQQLRDIYVDAGFNMLFERATFPNGSNSVENGIYEILNVAKTGKFKVFKGQHEFMDEWRQYHRDENGKIAKVRDDMLDAVRYGWMMKRFAVQAGSIYEVQNGYNTAVSGW